MQYYRHQTSDTSPKRRQIYVLNLLKNVLVWLPRLWDILTFNYIVLSHLYYLTSKLLSKLVLVLMPLILLTYSVNIQALSASTVQIIKGSEPYLTFDNGVTKVNTTESLLGITLSDGTAITPNTNTSTTTNPIVLPKENQSFADISMLVPTTTDTIPLNSLIGTPYNYWDDDDGDGQGANGITVSGNLSVSITDKENQAVSRSTTLDICQAPYKVVLTSTNGSLTTRYGVPNSSSFNGSSTTYYINPKAGPIICYAKPNLRFGTGPYAGPANIWNPHKGFLVQSTDPSSYSYNFPTTGANNLYFDLDIAGTSSLIWPTVTNGGIKATMTPTPGVTDGTSVRVTLTGPVATDDQIKSNSPSLVSKPDLSKTTFELIGYDNSNNAVVKYGFVLKQWFVNRGDEYDIFNQASWCSSIGYRLPQVKDLTNAIFPNSIGAKPSSSGNNYERRIGAGFFTEWGYMDIYTSASIIADGYWTSDSDGSNQFDVASDGGYVEILNPTDTYFAVCAYP